MAGKKTYERLRHRKLISLFLWRNGYHKITASATTVETDRSGINYATLEADHLEGYGFIWSIQQAEGRVYRVPATYVIWKEILTVVSRVNASK